MTHINLRPDEDELLGQHRCARCAHLIGLHIYDSEYDDHYCAVCTCMLEPIGPITRQKHEHELYIASRPRTPFMGSIGAFG